MLERSVEVVYSDDVRHEASQQFSLIGVYTQAVRVPTFPFVMPKLSLWFTLRSHREDPIRSLKIVVLDEAEQLLAEATIDQATLDGQEQIVASLDWSGLEEPKVEMGIHLMISPLVLNGPTLIRPRVITERETMKVPALRIQLAE